MKFILDMTIPLTEENNIRHAVIAALNSIERDMLSSNKLSGKIIAYGVDVGTWKFVAKMPAMGDK